MFVSVLDTSCIDSLHVRKIDQGTNDWFHCFTPHSNHFLGIVWVLGELLMHSVVMFFMNAIVYLFKLGAFAAAGFSKWTVFTRAFTTSIGPFSIAFAVGLFSFKG
mgnify:CR=1 FL=1